MKIKINNTEIEVYDGEKLIEVARRNNIEVPSLCYVSGYKHQASCMVCVMKNNETGQMIPSCSTIVTDGMNIESDSEEIKELRRQSLELLLSDHIAVCRPPCQPANCTLRKHTLTYRAKWNRYSRYSALKSVPPQHIKGNFWFDVAKCIRCGLCVYNTQNGFTFKGRGFGMSVVLPPENTNNVDESLCDICPTQALYIEKE